MVVGDDYPKWRRIDLSDQRLQAIEQARLAGKGADAYVYEVPTWRKVLRCAVALPYDVRPHTIHR